MKREFNFLGCAKIALTFSALCIIGSIYIWFAKGNEKYGVDFTGGTEVVLQVSGSHSSDDIRTKLDENGVADPIVQSFEKTDGMFTVRFSGEDKDPEVLKTKITNALGSFGDVKILSSSFVGPVIGQELRANATIAMVLVLVMMLVYVTIRFEFAFALGAVAAIFHDVIVTLGAIVLLGQQVNMATLAAALTIIGYSINDTLVIFDRVREEIFKGKDTDLTALVNRCLNITLARTIITSLLTWFSVLALLVVGGGSIKELSLFLVIGIIAGSYSTIYIASPIAIAWENFRHSKKK